MLLSEVLDTQPELDADYIVERIEAEMLIELFGGLGGVARAGMDKMKQAGQAVKGAYNDGEVRALLAQLGKYKDQLKALIQKNPQSFAQQSTMQARPAVDPRAQYQQQRSTTRRDQRAAVADVDRQLNRPASALTTADARAGNIPRPARRRVGPAPISNFDPVPSQQRKPHIKLKSRRAHMESQEMHDEIINELFGGLGGIARAGMDKIKQAGKGLGASYAKGEARAIIKKMMDVVSALKERGYQLPPDLAKEVAAVQQAAA